MQFLKDCLLAAIAIVITVTILMILVARGWLPSI